MAHAKDLGLNRSGLVEHAIDDAIRAAAREAWLAQNQDGIAEYNERVAKHGVFSDDWRTF
jgi:antitoxin CcdA